MAEKYGVNRKQKSKNEFTGDKTKGKQKKPHGFTIVENEKELIISWRGYQIGYPMVGLLVSYAPVLLFMLFGGGIYLVYQGIVVITEQGFDAPLLNWALLFICLIVPMFSLGIFLLSRINHEIFKLNRMVISDEKIRLVAMTRRWWGTREFYVDEIDAVFIKEIPEASSCYIYVRLQNTQKPVVLIHNAMYSHTAKFLVDEINLRLEYHSLKIETRHRDTGINPGS